MDRFFAILCDGVHRFEGTVNKFTGDGIMALFGAPIAHEDHAQRACYAALHLQRELAALRRGGAPRAGAQLLGSDRASTPARSWSGRSATTSAMDYTAVGHTVGLAQRMEQLAAADRVYLSEHTAALVEGYFALTTSGEFQVKGASGPVRVYELRVSARPADGSTSHARAASRASSGATRSCDARGALSRRSPARAGGRDRRRGGRGQEPPLPRVRRALRARRASRCYHVAGLAHARAVPLLPRARAAARVLRDRRAGLRPDGPRADRRQAAAARRGFAEDLPLMFDFLGVPDPERPTAAMDPEARQRQLLGLDEAPEPRRERSRAERDRVRGPALARPGERGVPRQPRRGDPGDAGPDRPQFPAGVPRAWMSQVLLPPDRPRAARPRGDEADARRRCSAPTRRSPGWPS